MRRLRRLHSALIVAAICVLSVAVPVLAQTYYADISVSETGGTSYSMFPFMKTLNVSGLATNNYITPTGLDTRVLEGATELPHMLASDRVLFADDLSANSSNTYQLTMGNSALTSFDIVTGRGGSIAVADHATLELGDSFEIEFVNAYVDTASGSDKNLVYKLNAFRLYVSGAGTITADINNGAKTVAATGVASGVHTIEVIADGTDMKIYIDTVEEDTVSLGAVSVTDNANNWTFMQNNVIPYAEHIMIYTAN